MSRKYKPVRSGPFKALSDQRSLAMSQSMKKRNRSSSYSVKSKRPRAISIKALDMEIDKRQIAKSEKKYIDRYYSGNMNTSTTSTGNVADPSTYACLNSCQQGDNKDNRDGKLITITSVQVSGTIRFLGKESSSGSNAPSPPSGKVVWVQLVQNTQNNLSTALDSTELHFNAAATTQGNAFLIRNNDFIRKYKVLAQYKYDLPARPFLKEVVAVDAGNIVADYYSWPEYLVDFSMYYKFKKPLKVRFSGNTGNLGDIVDNSLHIAAGYGVQSETDAAPVLTYNARVHFVDV